MMTEIEVLATRIRQAQLNLTTELGTFFDGIKQ
jgi:hypothetical protein